MLKMQQNDSVLINSFTYKLIESVGLTKQTNKKKTYIRSFPARKHLQFVMVHSEFCFLGLNVTLLLLQLARVQVTRGHTDRGDSGLVGQRTKNEHSTKPKTSSACNHTP